MGLRVAIFLVFILVQAVAFSIAGRKLITSNSQTSLRVSMKRFMPKSQGYIIAKNPLVNKGTSFPEFERDRLGVRGLFPCGAPQSLDEKVTIAMEELEKKSTPLDKYQFLHSIQDADETLFYAILVQHTMKVMPLVYTPTVGTACLNWHRLHRSVPRGIYLSKHDKGRIPSILENYPLKDIKVIVITDGERILGLGDLGVNGMGIPVGKLALYTACAGINPSECLPVHLDMGTNNEEFLKEGSGYQGLREKRASPSEVQQVMDEFMATVAALYPKALVQFEDFGNGNAFTLLNRYEKKYLCFNDDIQGTASVALGGMLASQNITNKKLSEHTYLFFGAGEAGVGIADLLADAMVLEDKISIEEAKSKIWLVDSQGLVTKNRNDFNSGSMAHHKLSYAKNSPAGYQAVSGTSEDQLLAAIAAIKPTSLIGVSAQSGAFSSKVLEAIRDVPGNEHPVVFALSNPTSKAECTAETFYSVMKDKGVFASGSPFDAVKVQGSTYIPGQGNNAYIFPGVGLAALAAQAKTLQSSDFYVAAKALASCVNKKQLAHKCLYPPLEKIRSVSLEIATAVAKHIYDTGRSKSNVTLTDINAIRRNCKRIMYEPKYNVLIKQMKPGFNRPVPRAKKEPTTPNA